MIDQLKLAVLKKINHSQWASPTFIIPKKSIWYTDFREVNKE